jgi:hypothetical protein
MPGVSSFGWDKGWRFIGGGGCGVRIEEFRDTKPKKQTSKRPACLQSHAALDQETRICRLDSSALNRAARNFQLPSLALGHFCHHAVRPKDSRVWSCAIRCERRHSSAAKRGVQSLAVYFSSRRPQLTQTTLTADAPD